MHIDTKNKCEHWDETPSENRMKITHLDPDCSADCPHGFHCCENCAENIQGNLLMEYLKYAATGEVTQLLCLVGGDGKHYVPSFAQRVMKFRE